MYVLFVMQLNIISELEKKTFLKIQAVWNCCVTGWNFTAGLQQNLLLHYLGK